MNPRRPHRLRSTVPFGLLVCAFFAFTAGCGGSSSGGGHGAADKFVGRWEIDPNTGPFHLSDCSDGSDDGDALFWTELIFQYGELTDISESSGVCVSYVVASPDAKSPIPGFSYNVDGDVAKLPATDPFTDEAPVCGTVLGSDMDGNVIDLVLVPDPTSWEFRLEPEASGQPQRAVLGVKAGGAPAILAFIADETGAELAHCNFTGGTTFFRFSTE